MFGKGGGVGWGVGGLITFVVDGKQKMMLFWLPALLVTPYKNAYFYLGSLTTPGCGGGGLGGG